MDFIDRQIGSIEQAQDDVAFTKALAESNRALEKLHQEIDIEEIEQAKELQMEGKMRSDELAALLDDDDDELKEELDRIEAEMFQANFNNANVDLGRSKNA